MTTYLHGSSRKTNFTQKKSHPPVGPPIAPAIISRVPVFQPTFKRGKTGIWKWETAWGTATVEGRLTGIHRKVLDAMFGSCVDSWRVATGAVTLLIDPYKVVTLAGIAKDNKRLRALMEEMRVAKVTIEASDGKTWFQAGIVSEIRISGVDSDDGRDQWLVTISATWMNIFDTSLVVRYRNFLPTLAGIRSSTVHAIALHVLSHQEGYYDVEDLLKRVGAWPNEALKPESFKRLVRKRFEALDTHEKILEELGMSLYTDKQGKQMLRYVPPVGVGVQKALPLETKW